MLFFFFKLRMLPLLHKTNTAASKSDSLYIVHSIVPLMLKTITSKCRQGVVFCGCHHLSYLLPISRTVGKQL